MPNRWFLTAIVVVATLIPGCTSDRHSTSRTKAASPSSATQATAATETSTATPSPVAQLDSSQCVDVTGANLDLLTASDSNAARKAADTLERYSPPGPVKDAIEHFVSVGGAHFADPEFTKSSKAVDAWVKQVCPT